MKKHKDISTFEEHLDRQYGRPGNPKRQKFEIKAKKFIQEEINKAGLHDDHHG